MGVDTINTVIEILPNSIPLGILSKLLEDADDTNSRRDCTSFNVVSSALQSNIFADPDSQIELCNIGLNLIVSQFKKGERSESFSRDFNKAGNAFKERTLELIKDIYETCRKRRSEGGEIMMFIRTITEQLLPDLTFIIPDKFERERTRRERERTF